MLCHGIDGNPCQWHGFCGSMVHQKGFTDPAPAMKTEITIEAIHHAFSRRLREPGQQLAAAPDMQAHPSDRTGYGCPAPLRQCWARHYQAQDEVAAACRRRFAGSFGQRSCVERFVSVMEARHNEPRFTPVRLPACRASLRDGCGSHASDRCRLSKVKDDRDIRNMAIR